MILRGSGERERGFAGPLRPIRSGQVGKDEQGFPKIGGPIVQFFRNGGLRVTDESRVCLDQIVALLTEVGTIESAETLALLGPGFPLHANDDTAIRERIGEAANGG